jgi:transposase
VESDPAVREKFSCRSCVAITQPPAPSHPIARGRVGPGLLAHVLFSKYGLRLPLNRQSAVYAREGVDLDVSTLADWVGAAAATLDATRPIDPAAGVSSRAHPRRRHHRSGSGQGKNPDRGLWTYVRDDRAFAGSDPPAVAFFAAPNILNSIWRVMLG